MRRTFIIGGIVEEELNYSIVKAVEGLGISHLFLTRADKFPGVYHENLLAYSEI